MDKKVRLIISSVLLVPLIWFYASWVIKRSVIFEISILSEITIKTPIIVLGTIITLLVTLITYLISDHLSKSNKFKLWGIAFIIASLPLADSLGFVFAILDKNPFAWLSTLIIFPLFLIAGLSLLLTGFFRKNTAS